MTIYIRLLDEGIEVFRPIQVCDLGNGVYKILSSIDYNPENEKWEFPPGSLIRCEKRHLENNEVFIAVKF